MKSVKLLSLEVQLFSSKKLFSASFDVIKCRLLVQDG